jgi:PhoPQ-activated pathogenicity-related protein
MIVLTDLCNGCRTLVPKKIATVLTIATIFISSSVAFASQQTALDEYVNAYDPSYNYTLWGPPIPGNGYQLYVILMYSQKWRTLEEVDRNLWTHWMAMVVPDIVSTDTGMLIVGGGKNTPIPDIDGSEVAAAVQFAVSTQSVVSIIGQIPNQPLFFYDEPFAHSEDELVAYTYDKALDTLDWTWPAYLPMTKASVRAMDTIQTLSLLFSPQPVNQFVVAGFSKRGATSWLTAAVDQRVRAIAPGVFDILNMEEQVEHHFAAYGFYSEALEDYENYNILRRVRTPEGQSLMEIVDPYRYRDRLVMPKFLLNSSGDEFFLPDSARFYLDDLLGEKTIRYVANTGHGLETAPGDVEDALTSLLAWYSSILYDVPRPKIAWTQNNGQLLVQTDQPHFIARFWQAHNPAARDFRLETIGRTWQFVPLIPTSPGMYTVPVPATSEGWTAYYVDIIFPGVSNIPQTYSTPIFVTPNTLPFEASDPLVDPRGLGFWKHQVKAAITGNGRAQIPANVLMSYFPLPLFDQSIANLEQAFAIFEPDASDIQTRALQHCLALRLNVRDEQLGWYTSLSLDGENTMPLWRYYTDAHRSFMNGEPIEAKDICEAINEL